MSGSNVLTNQKGKTLWVLKLLYFLFFYFVKKVDVKFLWKNTTTTTPLIIINLNFGYNCKFETILYLVHEKFLTVLITRLYLNKINNVKKWYLMCIREYFSNQNQRPTKTSENKFFNLHRRFYNKDSFLRTFITYCKRIKNKKEQRPLLSKIHVK